MFKLKAYVVILALLSVSSNGIEVFFETNMTYFPSDTSGHLATLKKLTCICSPTKRGYLKEQVDFLRKERLEAKEHFSLGVTAGYIYLPWSISNSLIEEAFNGCARKYGAEACINADAALRKEGLSYCHYAFKSGQNIASLPASLKPKRFGKETVYGTLDYCSRVAPSLDIYLGEGPSFYEYPIASYALNSTKVKQLPAMCDCSPSSTGYLKDQVQLMRNGRVKARKEYKRLLKLGKSKNDAESAEYRIIHKNWRSCVKLYKREACHNADAALRKEGNAVCSYDLKTGRNMFATGLIGKQRYTPVRRCSKIAKFASTPAHLGRA